jgi:hypothetical protein
MNAMEKNYFIFSKLHSVFESLKFDGYNKEWADFLMNKDNLLKLIELEYKQPGFIARIYNNYEKIKEFGRSNKGRQHYRKVTIDMCLNYLDNGEFVGVDENSVDVASAISYYTNDQHTFDEAKKIHYEYLKLKEEGKIEDHILCEELKETIIDDIYSILSNLNDAANENFSYEYLSKYDAKNMVLGKYCSCCAHLEGVGKGITKASILHPDCQNLILRDGKGKIIAKSTLYVNRKQGYALFNNIEMNDSVIGEENKKKIYEKYIQAINDFIRKYNEKNIANPLTQVNVGMYMNDLEDLIKENHEKADLILSGVSFSCYGGYNGDWQRKQHVIWKSKK